MKALITLLLLASSMSTYADSFYVLVGYICDAKNDQLLLTYDGAYNEDGEAMMANKRNTQWDPWSLVTLKDDDHIGTLKTVRANCRLSDGLYKVTITPSPGNFNIQGRCGAWMTASATVTKGREIIARVPRFESDCLDIDTSITTRVVVRAKERKPEVKTVQSKEFYK